MSPQLTTLSVATTSAYGALDVTDEVVAAVRDWADGPVLISMEHTTAGLVLGPSDDGQMRDYARFAEHAFEELGPFEHRHDHEDVRNGREHLLSTIVGTQVVLPIRDGRLSLGRWQRLLVLEFDGPKTRRLHVARLLAP